MFNLAKHILILFLLFSMATGDFGVFKLYTHYYMLCCCFQRYQELATHAKIRTHPFKEM